MPDTGVLGGVGGTAMVELAAVVPAGAGRVLLKLEGGNPTGSMKDRMAVAVINAAESRGDIQPGDTVVEYTAGTTGVSLAFVCAAKGYQLHAVLSDAFSEEKRRTMQAYGGRVTDVLSDNGRITEALIKAMIDRAGRISREPGHWWADQLDNHDAIAGYHPSASRRASADRSGTRCVLIEAHDEWQVTDRRYLSEASMALLTQPEPTPLNTRDTACRLSSAATASASRCSAWNIPKGTGLLRRRT